jgi:ligand-binding SRPBCC domain-containing protein
VKGKVRRRQAIPGTPAEVFPFFEDPVNLERITPRWLRFRISEAPPPPLRRGSRLRYRLRLWGVPLEWVTLIDRFDPGRGFVDTQVRGPYLSWIHVHFFTPMADSAGRPFVLMEDRVDYEIPLGRLGGLAAPVVAAQLDGIFRYRRRRVEELLGTRSVHSGGTAGSPKGATIRPLEGPPQGQPRSRAVGRPAVPRVSR